MEKNSDIKNRESKTVNHNMQNSNKSTKKEKGNKKLPDNFFENVLDLELKIKREFVFENLQELVYLYSIAIEYYESIEDFKYRDYQNRLNNLLSQPDILKKMNDCLMKKAKTKNADLSEVDHAKKLKNEKEKNNLKLKVNYFSHINNFTNHNDKVDKIMKMLIPTDDNEEKLISSVMRDELNKQQNNYKGRLEEKRRRTTKLTHEDTEKFDRAKKRFGTFVSGINGINLNFNSNDEQISSNEENADNNKSENIFENCDKDEPEVLTSARTKKTEQTEKTDKTEKSHKSNNLQENNQNDNIEICLETSFEKIEKTKIDEVDDTFTALAGKNGSNNEENGIIEIKMNSNNTNFEKTNNREINYTSMFKINESVLDSKNIGPKHKQIFMDLKQTTIQFVNEFNLFFYEYVFQRFTDHVQKLMDEKYLKYIEISKNYQSQIKEMQFLLTGDSEDQHKEGIQTIIDSLKEEQDIELDRIDDHYSKLIVDAQANFRNLGFKNNPGIQLVEEKFKLDMYNLLNTLLGPKK